MFYIQLYRKNGSLIEMVEVGQLKDILTKLEEDFPNWLRFVQEINEEQYYDLLFEINDELSYIGFE